MAVECFVPKVFTMAHRVEIRRAREIISEFARQGFRALTLRSIYYQFVARDYIENNFQSYKRLADILNCARLAGEIDWSSITDNVRNLDTPSAWDDGVDMMNSAASWFRRNPWEDRDVRIEVWVEKDAVVGFVQPVTRRYRVPLFACRGYTSQSEAYSAGKRIGRYIAEGKRVLVLHLGDHDPSGIDMSRDNEQRLRMFSGTEDDSDFEFRRIALNWDQIQQYNPPANFAKITDSRARGPGGYIATYGEDSYELDALSPTAIDEIITANIEPEVDQESWDAVMAEEAATQGELETLRDHYASLHRQKPWLKLTPEEVRDAAIEVADEHEQPGVAGDIAALSVYRDGEPDAG